MSISSCLKGILADKALVSPSSKGMMILREKNVMKVEVFGVPADITVINMNRIGSLSGLKDGEWKRHCDYLIVLEDDGVDHALFIELKRTLGEDKEYAMDQLSRSIPLLEYLRRICEIHFADEPKQSELPARYVLIAERNSTRFDKQPVRPIQRLPSEEYRNITINPFLGSRIGFNRLWCRSSEVSAGLLK